jgi:hypothetical protein
MTYTHYHHFNRAQRRLQQRRLRKLDQAALDRVIAADRAFFDRFPDRQYRIRQAAEVEIDEFEIILNFPLRPRPPDKKIFIGVKKLADGVRRRMHFAASVTDEVDVSETVARELFERLARGETISADNPLLQGRMP